LLFCCAFSVDSPRDRPFLISLWQLAYSFHSEALSFCAPEHSGKLVYADASLAIVHAVRESVDVFGNSTQKFITGDGFTITPPGVQLCATHCAALKAMGPDLPPNAQSELDDLSMRFIQSATMHFYFGERCFEFAEIRRREGGRPGEIDASQTSRKLFTETGPRKSAALQMSQLSPALRHYR